MIQLPHRSESHALVVSLGGLMAIAGMVSSASAAQFDAHEHGHGEIGIVVEGDELLVDVRMPNANVLGFEHAPRSDAERALAAKAMARLKHTEDWLMPQPSGACELEGYEIELGEMRETGGHDDHKHDDHDKHAKHDDDKHDGHDKHAKHDEHKHDDHDKHAKHDDHDKHDHDKHAKHDDHDHGKHDGEEHSELHAQYVFHCKSATAATALKVDFSEVFMKLEEVKATVVTSNAQRVQELGGGAATLKLR